MFTIAVVLALGTYVVKNHYLGITDADGVLYRRCLAATLFVTIAIIFRWFGLVLRGERR
jgi:hypothetical protein